MKTLLITLMTLLFTLPAMAKQFAACSGDHHGTYLDFMVENGQVKLGTWNDGEMPSKTWKIVKLTKDGKALQPKAYSWAIRQAIKATAKQEYYGMVLIEAKFGSETLFVNLNKYSMEQFIVVNGYVESLDCPIESIAD